MDGERSQRLGSRWKWLVSREDGTGPFAVVSSFRKVRFHSCLPPHLKCEGFALLMTTMIEAGMWTACVTSISSDHTRLSLQRSHKNNKKKYNSNCRTVRIIDPADLSLPLLALFKAFPVRKGSQNAPKGNCFGFHKIYSYNLSLRCKFMGAEFQVHFSDTVEEWFLSFP